MDAKERQLNKEVEVRRMTEKDMPSIRVIDQLITGKQRASSWLQSAEVVWLIRRPPLSFVAEVEGRVAGFLLGDIRGAEYGTPTSGWIDIMGVHPDFQRLGIGRRLVERFSSECQWQHLRVRVIIREDDIQLVRFWRAMGFGQGKLIDFER